MFGQKKSACPDCGEDFDVADYQFEPEAVSFHCPHCDEAYYGYDVHGLPHPRNFDCTGCKKFLVLQDFIVVAEAEGAVGVLRTTTPWDERRRIGICLAWWRTFVMSLGRQKALFRIQSPATLKELWGFSFISIFFCFFAQWIYEVLAARGGGTGEDGAEAAFGGSALIGLLLLGVPVAAIMAAVAAWVVPFCWACAAYLALLVVASNRKGFRETFKAAMYSTGPLALGALPFCGVRFAPLLMIWTFEMGIKEVHEIDSARAWFAAGWPGVLALVVILGLVAQL